MQRYTLSSFEISFVLSNNRFSLSLASYGLLFLAPPK